jgi:DNA-binding MarR family transcriptional regulator
LVVERLKRELTRRERDVLLEAVRLGTFTNSQIARSLQVKPPNITKYLNSLLERRFIYPHHRSGRQVFYSASEDVRIVRDLPEATQRALFD